MEDAEHGVTGQQRHAEHHADALLPQDRIRHGGGVDPIEPDRTPPGSDAASETDPDGDPDTLADLFFDAAGGARHQLVRALVDQQDSRGVGVEDLPNSLEEFDQQIVEIEVRQLGGRERLEIFQAGLGVPVSRHVPHESAAAALAPRAKVLQPLGRGRLAWCQWGR